MANIAELSVKLGADTSDFRAGTAQVSKGLKGIGKEACNVGNSFKGLGGIIAGALSVGAVIGFATEVFNVTSQFQKFEAVLTNTLGSAKSAQTALLQISETAAKTNFSVQELTDSYVKFANRGIKLSQDELIKLADVANSTGKSFDQLTEAALDSFTGENERLKEFGIIAKKTGETTQFTFKGVTTEVKNTQEAIKNYIIGLGDLQGVTGSTAAISETLGGKASNLGDAFDSLFVNIGKGTSGPISSLISGFTELINLLAISFKSVEQIREEVQLLALSDTARKGVEEFTLFRDRVKELSGGTADLTKSTDGYIQRLKESIAQSIEKNGVDSQNVKLLKEELLAIEDFLKTEKKASEAQAAKNAAKKSETGLLQKLNAELKIQKELVESATNENQIAQANERISLIDKEINRLQELGKVKQNNNLATLTPMGMSGEGVTGLIDVAPALAQIATLSVALDQIAAKSIEVSDFLKASFTDMTVTLAESFGQLAVGSIGLRGFLDGIIFMLIDFASQFGKLLITQGIAMVALKESLATNPYVAIAAGAVLVAAAAATKALVKKGAIGGTPALAQGGLAFGPTLALVGDNRNAGSNPEVIAPLNKLKGMMGDGGGTEVTGEFRIKGSDLVAAVERQNNRERRVN